MKPVYNKRVAAFIQQLVNPSTARVRFRSLIETHDYLLRSGFNLSWKRKHGPEGGWMLYYHGGGFRGGGEGIIVRIKTHGDSKGWRAFKPHLSVTWQQGISTLDQERRDYKKHETAKFNAQGEPESKSAPKGDAAQQDAWADRTHPLFPGFDASCVTHPMGLYGAETLEDHSGSA